MTAARRGEAPDRRLSAITRLTPDVVATATLAVETGGPGFTDITRDVARFVADAGAKDGALLLFLRHTSASLVIQENADPDVLVDLGGALDRLAPADAGWIHDVEGPDDMPAHVKSVLIGSSVSIPIAGGKPLLGTWQGIYLAEHRDRASARTLVLTLQGEEK